ncbi:hypothetical protein MMC26_004507 [Xylographa opegraphella]|nr:hypothetical protein [Xylographa opegraphella]
MATAAVQVPSCNRMLPGSYGLKPVHYPKSTSSTAINSEEVVNDWVSLFNNEVHAEESDFTTLFPKGSYWRDLLCLTWDFHTLNGPEKIDSLFKTQLKGCRIKSLTIDRTSNAGKPQAVPFGFDKDAIAVQSFLTLDTDVGRGRGLVRLLQDSEDEGKWKAFTLFTALQELNGHEESTGERRPLGTERNSRSPRKNWKEKRIAEENLEGDLEPSVLIVGTIHPRHIIQATGASGEPYFPSDIEGLADFQGDRLVHSSKFDGPRPHAKGKKALIVGSCNSAHDIAQDYLENEYEVTMVQRSSTLVITSQSLIDVTMKGVYSEDGPSVEDADLINYSVPNPVLKLLHIAATQEMMKLDAPILRGLLSAGFALDSGPDASGLMMKYLHRGGGYYIDVGASQMIADGKIKVKQGQEISRINAHSETFADGDELEADEIVFATGYQNMRETARKIFGDALADRVGDVWGFDEEGETRGMWRRSGHPGFWFFGGNLALCRYYSRLLALQIKALEVGLIWYEDA